MMLEKVSSRIPKGLKYLSIILVGLVMIWLSLRLETGLTNPFYVATGDSMWPTFRAGDLLVVKATNGGMPFESLKVGDIIVFHNPVTHNKVLVSRIAQIMTDSQAETVMIAKGDANRNSIPRVDYPIRKGDYIGKVVYTVPDVGQAIKVLSPPINYILLIGVPLGIVLYYRNKKRRILRPGSRSN
jgi:signal peptidase I